MHNPPTDLHACVGFSKAHQVKLNAQKQKNTHDIVSKPWAMCVCAIYPPVRWLFSFWLSQYSANAIFPRANKWEIALKLCHCSLFQSAHSIYRKHRKKAAADCFLRFNKGAREIISSAALARQFQREELTSWFLFLGKTNSGPNGADCICSRASFCYY